MADSGRSSTSITDLDMDTLTRCASYLSLREISNMAMSCKYLNRAAYSDSIWQSLYRQEWPQVGPLWSLQPSSIREAFLSRHTDLHQFKYVDPLSFDISILGKSPQHILFDKNTIIFSQGPSIRSLHTDNLINGVSVAMRGNHNARVTCMRLFSLNETSSYQNDSERDDNILITSSCDHFIRLWWKGGNRCFKGHSGPVSTLSDKLLGDNNGKIIASGGEDGTVRLWSINSSGKRGQHALRATFHGHDKAVLLISVAGHKASLLVSISKNGKVRVWDTAVASSSSRFSCCVGMASLPMAPVGLKCHESLLYVAAGSSVITVDVRTMRKVSTVVLQEKIHSFEVLPSKSVFCTGATGRAMMWDTRRFSDKVKPTVELDGHEGPVNLLHMDSYKIVTGGPDDPYVNVWEANTGAQTNSLVCSAPDRLPSGFGCSAMGVNGCRIVTAGSDNEDDTVLRFRDFSTATCNASSNPLEASSTVSKFWGSPSDSDSEEVE